MYKQMPTVKPSKSLDCLSALLGFLTVLPGLFLACIFYVGRFQETTASGLYITALIAVGISLPPALLTIRGILRLTFMLLNALLVDKRFTK